MNFRTIMFAFYLVIAVCVVLAARWCSTYVGNQVQQLTAQPK